MKLKNTFLKRMFFKWNGDCLWEFWSRKDERIQEVSAGKNLVLFTKMEDIGLL